MPNSVLIYRTREDLKLFQSIIGSRTPDAEIPIIGEPALGAVMYRGITRKQNKRIQAICDVQFAVQTEEESLKAILLIELLRRQDTGQYYRSMPAPDSEPKHVFWNGDRKVADDVDADAAHRYMAERGLEYAFRSMRRGFGPGIVAAVKADAIYEGRDYYHFGFQTGRGFEAGNERMKAYRDKLMEQLMAKPWSLMVGGLERGGDSRWAMLAGGALVVGRIEMAHPVSGAEADVLVMKFDARDEARTAALEIRAAVEFRADMKVIISTDDHHEEVGAEAIQ